MISWGAGAGLLYRATDARAMVAEKILSTQCSRDHLPAGLLDGLSNTAREMSGYFDCQAENFQSYAVWMAVGAGLTALSLALMVLILALMDERRLRRVLSQGDIPDQALPMVRDAIAEVSALWTRVGCPGGVAPDLRVADVPQAFTHSGLMGRPAVVVPLPLMLPSRRERLDATLAHEFGHLAARDIGWVRLARAVRWLAPVLVVVALVPNTHIAGLVLMAPVFVAKSAVLSLVVWLGAGALLRTRETEADRYAASVGHAARLLTMLEAARDAHPDRGGVRAFARRVAALAGTHPLLERRAAEIADPADALGRRVDLLRAGGIAMTGTCAAIVARDLLTETGLSMRPDASLLRAWATMAAIALVLAAVPTRRSARTARSTVTAALAAAGGVLAALVLALGFDGGAPGEQLTSLFMVVIPETNSMRVLWWQAVAVVVVAGLVIAIGRPILADRRSAIAEFLGSAALCAAGLGVVDAIARFAPSWRELSLTVLIPLNSWSLPWPWLVLLFPIARLLAGWPLRRAPKVTFRRWLRQLAARGALPVAAGITTGGLLTLRWVLSEPTRGDVFAPVVRLHEDALACFVAGVVMFVAVSWLDAWQCPQRRIRGPGSALSAALVCAFLAATLASIGPLVSGRFVSWPIAEQLLTGQALGTFVLLLALLALPVAVVAMIVRAAVVVVPPGRHGSRARNVTRGRKAASVTVAAAAVCVVAVTVGFAIDLTAPATQRYAALDEPVLPLAAEGSSGPRSDRWADVPEPPGRSSGGGALSFAGALEVVGEAHGVLPEYWEALPLDGPPSAAVRRNVLGGAVSGDCAGLAQLVFLQPGAAGLPQPTARASAWYRTRAEGTGVESLMEIEVRSFDDRGTPARIIAAGRTATQECPTGWSARFDGDAATMTVRGFQVPALEGSWQTGRRMALTPERRQWRRPAPVVEQTVRTAVAASGPVLVIVTVQGVVEDLGVAFLQRTADGVLAAALRRSNAVVAEPWPVVPRASATPTEPWSGWWSGTTGDGNARQETILQVRSADGAVTGTAIYPEAGCRGVLTAAQVTRREVTFFETTTVNSGSCTRTAILKINLVDADRLQGTFYRAPAGVDVIGTLQFRRIGSQ